MQKLARFVILLLVCFSVLPGFAQEATPSPEPRPADRLILATTTSTVDSGLLDFLLPVFEEQTGITVDVISVGTGQAFELGRNGDADVLLVHSRSQEDTFVEEGFAPARYDVMYNDFIIVGPADDPAQIRNAESASAALVQIAEAGATFVSRGDDSGTHTREQRLWTTAEFTPDGDWYISAGQGMGAVLNMSAELGAYTLSDRATYVARQADGLALDILYEGDRALFNPYGVLPVSPEKFPWVNAAGADTFIEWLLSVETQTLIGEYMVNDQVLFTPNSEAWLAAQIEATPESTPAS